MVLEGVDSIDWFTDRPDRVAGEWSPKKLVKKWDGLFGGDEPNAQATFEMGSKRKLVAFEMFKPKLSDSNQTLSFKVRGIGKKNKDLLTGLRNEQLSDASLFIDGTLPIDGSLPTCLPNCDYMYMSNADLSNQDLASANLTGTNLIQANLSNANLNDAILSSANLNDAILASANLTEADLSNANLSGANLTEAGLKGADLSNADLTGANLNFTTWGNTTCPNGDTNSGTLPCTAEQLNLA